MSQLEIIPIKLDKSYINGSRISCKKLYFYSVVHNTWKNLRKRNPCVFRARNLRRFRFCAGNRNSGTGALPSPLKKITRLCESKCLQHSWPYIPTQFTSPNQPHTPSNRKLILDLRTVSKKVLGNYLRLS